MNKKKAIKLATASMLTTSTFAAVAPFTADAASSTATYVADAAAKAKAAQEAYTVPAAEGVAETAAVVQKQVNVAVKAYDKAFAAVEKYTGKDKALLQSKLEVAKRAIDKAKGYVAGKTLAEGLNKTAVQLKADVSGKKYDAVKATLATFSPELANAEANIKAVVNGKEAEDAIINTLTYSKKVEKSATAYVAAVEAVPVVTGVSAINAKQIQITFNKAMNESLVEDVTKYSVKRAGAAAVALATSGNNAASAELSADGKTLTLTLTNALTTNHWGSIAEGDTFNFASDVLTTAEGKQIAAQTVAVKYSDKVAPQFVSASASAKATTTTMEVTFNEPVDFSVATVLINGTAASISAGSTPNKVIVTSGSNLLVGTTYNVSLLNFKDAAGNLTSVNPITTTVTVASDTVSPTITNIEVVRDSLLKVTFDKSMDASTLAASSLKVLDANLNSTGISQGAVTAVADTNNKQFYVELTALPFNTSGAFSGVLSFANTIKDASGNALVASVKGISLTKDTVAPQIVSTSYKKVTSYGGQTNANGFIVIKFNEAVTASAANTAYTVINNKTGATIATPISARAVNTSDSTELVLSLNAGVPDASTTYTVIAPSSAVTDKSIAANASLAANLTVDVSAGAPIASDTTAPLVASATETAATSASSGTTIAVAFNETNDMDVATVLNASNYRLDGNALPAGSYVTYVANTKTATINIPAGTISADKNYTLNVYNIKDAAGNTANPFVDTAITLKDDIKPVLASAVINSNGTASLGFSETIAAVASGAEADFVLKLNGSGAFNTGSNKAFTIADGTGADAGKYVVTVKKSVQGQAATSNTLTVNGVTYTTVGAADVVKFEFVDVDGSQTYNSGDILIKATLTGSTNAIAFAADGNYDLNNATSLTMGTASAPSVVKDTGSLLNVIKGSTVITVK